MRFIDPNRPSFVTILIRFFGNIFGKQNDIEDDRIMRILFLSSRLFPNRIRIEVILVSLL